MSASPPTPAPVRAAPEPVDHLTEATVRQAAGARRARLTRLLGVAAWASAVVAVLLWATSDAARFTGDGRVLIVLGIVAGLVGTDLVLVMLVLAARVPLIDRLVGHDAAMALHGRLGKPALYLLLAHGALLVVGYSLDSGEGIGPMIVALWETTDVRLAILGLGALVAVVVSSVIAVRRVLPYEVWHGVHLLSYAAVILAVPHQLQQGQVLAETSWQRSYWIALYALALGCIAIFRFGQPILFSLRHRVVVDRIEPVGDHVVSIHLRGRMLDRLPARGGQFLMWRFWGAGTWWHAHPLSLSAAPNGQGLRLTVRALGRGSGDLARLRPGTPVSFEGPYGVFTDATRTRSHMAVAASGIGITPIRAFLEDVSAPAGSVTILLRARNAQETYLWDEVIAWATAHGHRVLTSIGSRGCGLGAWLADEQASQGHRITSVFPALHDSDLYVCGPQRWADLVEADARAADLPRTQLHRERFSW